MRVLLLVMSLCSMQAFAMDDIRSFDADTGLYFHTIMKQFPRKGSGWVSSAEDAEGYYHAANIFIYDPIKKTGRNLFSKSPGKIKSLIIESEYDSRNLKMKFVKNADGSDDEEAIKNNSGIRSAIKPSGTFLVETEKCTDAEHCQHEIWKAGKRAGEPDKVVTLSTNDSWHFDVKNRVIRVLTELNGSIAVKEFAW